MRANSALLRTPSGLLVPQSAAALDELERQQMQSEKALLERAAEKEIVRGPDGRAVGYRAKVA